MKDPIDQSTLPLPLPAAPNPTIARLLERTAKYFQQGM